MENSRGYNRIPHSRSAGSDLYTINHTEPPDPRELASSVARRGRMFAKRHRRRLVDKTGDCNIVITNVSSRRRKYFVDIFTTMLDSRWRYNLAMFALAFVGSWFLFATIWWVICIAHEDHRHKDDSNWTPCMSNVYDFPTALLFSIETQHTIGYGYRAMEPKCPEAYVVLIIQCVIGVFLQSIVTGLIFAKISRPKARARTVLFSKHAVICQRDGELCLLFRIGDMRKSHIIGTSIRAIMVQNRLTKEGEIIPICQVPLLVETETSLPGDNYVFLGWPVTVVHRITKSSPLWNISADQLVEEKFELVVILDGTIESSGMTCQLRTSYLPTEILWGHHLAPLIAYQKEDGQYYVDFTMFHSTIPIEMPECSASMIHSNICKQHLKKTPSYVMNFTFSSGSTESINSKPNKKKTWRNLWAQKSSNSPALKRSFSEKPNMYSKRRNSKQSIASRRVIRPNMAEIQEIHHHKDQTGVVANHENCSNNIVKVEVEKNDLCNNVDTRQLGEGAKG